MRRLLSLLLGLLLVAGTLSVSAAPATADGHLAVQVVTIDTPEPGTLYVGGSWTPATTGGTSGEPVTLAGTPGVCTVADEVVTFAGAGACTVTASQAGDADHAAATPVERSFTIALRPVDLALTVTPAEPVDGDTVTVTAVVTDGLDGTAVDGTATLTATGTTPAGARAMSGTGGELTGTVVVTGGTTHTLTVAFTPSTPTTWTTGSASETVTALSTQTVTIDSPDPDTLHVAEEWTPVTTGGASGQAVTLTGTPGVCTVADGVVTFVAAGTCTVTASQAGDAEHAAAAPVTRSFTIALRPLDLEISWTDPPPPAHGDDVVVTAVATDGLDGTAVSGTATLTATDTEPPGAQDMAGSGGTLTRTITVSGGTTHTLTVAFTPTTPATWAAATASAELEAAKGAQDVTISDVPAAGDLLVGRSWTPTTTGGGSESPVTLRATPSSGRNAVCAMSTTSPGTVRFLGHGTCTVTATQDGDDHYLEGRDEVSFEVRRPVTVTLTTDPEAPVYGDEVTVVASATDTLDGSVVPLEAETDGLSVAGSDAVAVQDGDGLALTFEPAGAGDHEVEVDLVGSAEHQALVHVGTVTVAKAAQVIRIPEEDRPAPGLVGGTWTPEPLAGGAGTVVTVSVDGTSDSCVVQAGVVHFEGPGSCPLRFGKEGDADHEPAPDLLVELQVRIPVQLTLRSSPAAPVVGERVEIRAVARAEGGAATGTGPITVTGPGEPEGTDPEAGWFGGGKYFAFRPDRATTYTATATFQPADTATYAVATEQVTVTVGRAAQAITLGSPAPAPAYVLGTWDPAATGGGSGNDVTLATRTPSTCTVAAGVVSFVAVGTCQVQLDQAGDDDHLAAASVVLEATVVRIPVDVTVSWPGTPQVAEELVVTATATATKPDGTEVTVPGTGTLTVGDAGAATGAWTDGSLALGLTPVHAGTQAVTATFTPADGAVFESGSAPAGIELPVARGAQSISLGTEPDAAAYVGDRWTPAPVGQGSGQPVTLAVDAGPADAPACELAAGTAGQDVVYRHAGECVLTATLAETEDYLAAPPLVRSVDVLRHPTSVEVEVAGTALVARDLSVTATAGGLRHATTQTAVAGSVTFLVDDVAVGDPVPLVEGLAATVLQLPSAGEHAVAARFVPTDAVEWAPATDSEPVTTARSPQTITLDDATPTAGVVDGTWTPAPTASSGLTPVITLHPDSVAEEICALAEGTVTFLEPGDCTVRLDQPGDAEHLAAPQLTHTVAVDRTLTTTTVTLSGGTQVGTTAEVTATSDGTGAIAFSLVRGTDAAVSLGTPVPLVDGLATLEYVPSAIGEHQVIATLRPDPARVFHPSVGSAAWSVAKAPTTVAVAVTGGQVAVTVSADTPAGGVPTGTVAVTVGAEDPVDVPLVGGTASAPDVLAPEADVQVSAAYAGDPTRAGSSATVHRGVPTLTHSLSRAPGPHGWHDGPVTVAFRCTASTAPLLTACPAPVTLRAERADQGLLRSVTAADGGRAVLRVEDVDIDTTRPRVSVAGIRDGATYLGSVAAPRCSASDATSGISSCTVLPRRRLGRTEFRDTVVATDRAGNTHTASVRFSVLPEWVHRAKLRRGRWVTRRRTATIRVLGDSRAPRVLRPRRARGAPRVAAGLMSPVRISDGVWLWEKDVPVPRTRGRRPYRLAVQTGDERRQVLKVVVRRP